VGAPMGVGLPLLLREVGQLGPFANEKTKWASATPQEGL